MEMTEEQRQRAESNRLKALAKRKALAEAATGTNHDVWKLFKCRRISPSTLPVTKHPSDAEPSPIPQTNTPPLPEKFRTRLEICSPDSFFVVPEAIKGFPYPGEAPCLDKLGDCLSNVFLSHYTQNHGGGKACVYKLRDYDVVLRCLKNYQGIEIEEIPWGTLNVIGRLAYSSDEGRWMPCRPEHLSDEKVDEFLKKLPKTLLDALMPFQLEGVRFGLQRGGRCLIADEMGLGKTLQAIAIACCFMSEGPILVVCPAVLRFSWAEELERWLPFCLPADIHLVFGHKSNPVNLPRRPRVVVISYTMLHRLRKSILEQDWALLIVDESHHVRCTKKTSEPGEKETGDDALFKTGLRRLLLMIPVFLFLRASHLWLLFTYG
ncbi:SNF2 domain-containing protein [Actinidia rufa]|uniref:SNF2 domain-containing protein n=1 Tax=Actinidia rufa TaxID=165716 RepID=A0A7J0FYK6_9ERIC|nr:SNF2 domain-containing protein [Actinidia rufa]